MQSGGGASGDGRQRDEVDVRSGLAGWIDGAECVKFEPNSSWSNCVLRNSSEAEAVYSVSLQQREGDRRARDEHDANHESPASAGGGRGTAARGLCLRSPAAAFVSLTPSMKPAAVPGSRPLPLVGLPFVTLI